MMHGRRLATVRELIVLTTPESGAVLDRISAWADENDIALTVLDVGDDVTTEQFDTARETLGIVVGGDGVFLEAARTFTPHSIPFLGINTGSLAFLSRVYPEQATDALTEILRGRSTVHRRQQYHVSGADLDTTGINEVTIETVPPEKSHGRKVCKLHCFVDTEYVGEYFGTGLIISTPTGSTGQALSNDGPIHYPNNNFTLQIVPYQTHNVSAKPIVVSEESTIRVVPETEAMVVIDGGRHVTHVEDEVIEITGAERPVQVVRTSFDDPFMAALAGKLGWSLRELTDAGPTETLPETAPEDFLTVASRVAREAARAAGEALRELHGQVEQIKYKSDKADIVTEADYQSQHIIEAVIENEFPSHGFRSEEDMVVEGTPEYVWIVDPLDGTGNFAHGNPNYAISIAMVDENREPVVGVVYNPEADEMFHAVRGRGCYQNDVRAEPTDRNRLDEGMLLSGYDPQGAFLRQFYDETQGVRRIGSAALNLAYVAVGSADAVWENDTYPWDVAAGILLLREAGGRITDETGSEYRLVLDEDATRRPLLGSNGSLHDALLAHFER
ncbi:MAG: inositol monophosphatase family protein [Natronomonas sp.]